MKTKFLLAFLFSLFTCVSVQGQNLVPNPSFEDRVGCPNNFSQINKATGWITIRNTPDYFNSCSSSPDVSVPSNLFGFQYPLGLGCSAYAGLFTCYYFSPNGRELLGTQLISSLSIGQKYFVSLKTILSSGESGASNNIGVLFSTNQSIQGDFNPNRNFAQVRAEDVISDTLNWVTIFGSFIADSAYQFIEIGNFYDDSLTQLTNILGSPYYFIDDICVSTDSSFCANYSFVCNVGIQEQMQNTDVTLFPNPFSTQLTCSLTENEQTTISLYNFLGQQVLQQRFTNTTTINTEQIPNGIYIYELRNSKETLKTGKVVKQ